MSAFTTFGPGTITIGSDYSGEVLSVTVNHQYAEVGSTRTMMNGDIRRAKKRRDPDSITLNFETDLTAAGLYAMLQSSDLTESTITYVPSTEDGASWSGGIELSLPESVEGPEYGAPITASVTLNCLTTLTFSEGAAVS